MNLHLVIPIKVNKPLHEKDVTIKNLLEKIIKLEEKDPIRMKIYTPVYVKKEIIVVYRKLLET